MSGGITVVVHLWKGDNPKRVYLPEHVNTLASMFRRRMTLEHELVCVADEPTGLDKNLVRWVETPKAARELRNIPSPEGHGRFPSCYQRLWNWSDEARIVLGPRLLCGDIDTLLLDDPTPLCLYPDELVCDRPAMSWGNPHRVAGGLYLLSAGSHAHVWEKFRGPDSIAEARTANFRGSDQAWISYCVGSRAKIWPQGSGIYSVRDFLDKGQPVPADARLIHFNGPRKPWDTPIDWVREAWR